MLTIIILNIFIWSSTQTSLAQSISDCDEDMSINDCLKAEEEENISNQESEEDSGINQSSLFMNLLKMGLALLLVLGLIYLMVKILGRKNQTLQRSKVIENLGGLPLGHNKSIQLVRIGEEVYIIGVGEQINKIDKITDESLLHILEESGEQPEHSMNFVQDILDRFKKEDKTEEQDNSFNQLFEQELKKMQENRSEMLKDYQKRDDRYE